MNVKLVFLQSVIERWRSFIANYCCGAALPQWLQSSDVNAELLKGSDTKRTAFSLQKSVDSLPLIETPLDSQVKPRKGCEHSNI